MSLLVFAWLAGGIMSLVSAGWLQAVALVVTASCFASMLVGAAWLAESIGSENYTTKVRERFDVAVQGNTAMAMNHARRWMVRGWGDQHVGKARIFALLSAGMSLAYLASFLAIPVALFFNWKIAVSLIPFAVAAAVLAKWFNGLKLRELYGREAGRVLNDLDWASGRRIDP